MSEWIDELASKAAREQEQLRHQESVRLYKNSVIRAKLPNFVQALKEQVRKDINELRAKFPSDERRHCLMEDRGEMGFRISRRGPFPRILMQFECNADGQFARIIQYTEGNSYQGPIPSSPCELKISLSDDDDLQFKVLPLELGPDANKQFDNSAELARHLLQRVLK